MIVRICVVDGLALGAVLVIVSVTVVAAFEGSDLFTTAGLLIVTIFVRKHCDVDDVTVPVVESDVEEVDVLNVVLVDVDGAGVASVVLIFEDVAIIGNRL